MKPTEQNTKTPHIATGLFALLGGLDRGKGSGASSPALLLLATITATLLASAGLTAALLASASAYATTEGPPVFSSAPGLPDGRVYEQVSPADKNGNEAGFTTDGFTPAAQAHYGYAAADGNAVTFEGTGPMGESPSVDNTEFVASKNKEKPGWGTRGISPAPRHDGKIVTLEALGGGLRGFPSADLSHAVVGAGNHYTFASSLPTEECEGQIYLAGSDPYAAVTPLERAEIENPVGGCAEGDGPSVVGGTPSFSIVYFTYPGTLLPEDASRAPHADRNIGTKGGDFEADGFYESSEGALREAGVLPDGKLDEFGSVPAASVRLGNPVSADGSRAFFVSPDPDSCTQNGGENNCALDPPELYVRENGTRTVLVSQDPLRPAVGGLPAAAPGGALRIPNGTLSTAQVANESYVFASPDGSEAFFQSDARLTAAAPEGTEPKTYDFDIETGELTYLPNVIGEILATDTHGSAFAFVPPAAGGEPPELDLWSAGAGGGVVTPVARLPETLSEGAVTEARISSEGSVLVFDTSSRIASAFNSGGYEQVYRYDLATNTLGCVSCAPPGVIPNGNASISSLLYAHRGEGSGYAPSYGVRDSRGISANGERVFFDTPALLVPQDTNTNSPEVEVEANRYEKQGRDVYEWEDGVVYLVSGGKSPRDSFLLDSSENGEDVFFATTEDLVAGDTDGGFDVYDARIPHAGDNPPAAAVPCEGSVCQGPPNVPSPLTPPASATFTGLGNPAPEPAAAPPPPTVTKKATKCRKGYVKNKKGKCLKKAKAKSHKGGK